MFETTASITEGSSSWGIVQLTKRSNACLSGSGDRSGGSLVSPGSGGNGGGLSSVEALSILLEPTRAGGVASSTRLWSLSRNELDMGGSEPGSLVCLSYSPVDNTDRVYIGQIVGKGWSGGGKTTTYRYGSRR